MDYHAPTSTPEHEHVMRNPGLAQPRDVIQQLRCGEIRQERPSAPDTMFTTTGQKLYVIGDIDGRFCPRSNPYDLHTFGKPQEGDPLANRLQGVWAQAVKALNGYTFVIESGGISWPLVDAERFVCGSPFRSDPTDCHLPNLEWQRAISGSGCR